jgi:hypothetical protein
MASNLRVDQILPSTSTNVAIGTATGSVTLVGSVSGTSITNSGVTTVAAGSASAPSISPSGDSNTGIFFPAADTIAFAEGGVEALRINSSANIGIGTTSSPLKLTVVGNIKAGYEANTGLVLGLTPVGVPVNDVNAYILWGDNASFGGENGDLIYIPRTSTTGAHRFYTGNTTPTEKFKIDSSGNVSINNGNLVFSTAGKGIDFSATTNSSGTMSSELLSDYEEGTWTPALGGAATATYTSRTGTYTKIGNRVILFFEIKLATLSGSGTTWLTGNPFTPSGDDGDTGVVAITSGGSGAASSFCMVFSGDTNIYTYTQGSTVRSNWQVSILTGSAVFSGTVVYKTA